MHVATRLAVIVTVLQPWAAQAAEPSLTAKFQAELDSVRNEFHLPGATAAFVLPDGRVGEVASGNSDVERRTPMQVSSRMLSGSTGKTFVAATTLALAQEGKLKLDEPISVWLSDRPWFKRLPNHDRITLRELLTHSSGVPDHVYMDSFARDVAKKWRLPGNPFPPETLIGYVLDQPALFEPGKGYHYSDTGYLLVGLIIEKATNSTYYSQVERRFLVPLHLTRTTPSTGRSHNDLAAGYESADNPFHMPAKVTSSRGVLVYNAAAEWTGGGLVTNSRDLAVWTKTLYEGRAMRGNYLKDLLAGVRTGKDQGRYGMGVYIGPSPYGISYGHGGWIPGYRTDVRYYPDHRVSIAFQINTDVGMLGDKSPVPIIQERLTKIVVDSLKPH